MCETHENDRQGRADADASMACLQKSVDFSAALFSRRHFFSARKDGGGGFGLGIDRLTMLLLGLTIKDAMFIFRGPNRLTP